MSDMIPTILQIHFGDEPNDEQKAMMFKWEEFASNNNYKYRVIQEIPDYIEDKNMGYRFISDIVRIKELIEHKRHLYVDTDTIPLVDTLELDSTPMLFPSYDNSIYNGDNVDFFKEVLDTMIFGQDGGITKAIIKIMQTEYRKLFERLSEIKLELSKEELSCLDFDTWVNRISKFSDWLQPTGVIEHYGWTMNEKIFERDHNISIVKKKLNSINM